MSIDSTKRYHRIERNIYIIFWALVLIAPIVVELNEFLSGADATPEIKGIIGVWIAVLPFFILFWIHNIFLAPLLLFHRKKWLYALLLVVALSLTILLLGYNHNCFAHRHHHKFKKEQKQMQDTAVVANESVLQPFATDSAAVGNVSKDSNNTASISAAPNEKGSQNRHRRHGPLYINMFLISHLVFAIAVVTANLAVKLTFKSMSNNRRIADLESENTATRLKVLKNQINPHFFMNTLNNIHALIDIDTERAQYAVIELSKMMRYVLYDIDNRTVSLAKEVEFLRNYVELMRMRLTDSVEVRVNLPEECGNCEIPPMILVPFVENMFKHGVSYRQSSLLIIDLVLTDDNKIVFKCVNSNHAKTDHDNHHGIGVDNTRRRLDLIYPGDYTLDINSNEQTFAVTLIIPTHQ